MTLEEIGRLLRETRERKGLTLHDVQVATKIRLKYLEAIERGDDSQLPPEVYTRGFIRAYANLLELDGVELARAYAEWKQGGGSPAGFASSSPEGAGAAGEEHPAGAAGHGTGAGAGTRGSGQRLPAKEEPGEARGPAGGLGGRAGRSGSGLAPGRFEGGPGEGAGTAGAARGTRRGRQDAGVAGTLGEPAGTAGPGTAAPPPAVPGPRGTGSGRGGSRRGGMAGAATASGPGAAGAAPAWRPEGAAGAVQAPGARPAGARREAGEVPPPGAPLVAPLPPRSRRRRAATAGGYRTPRRRARPWGLIGGVALGVVLLAAAGLYVVGAPDRPPGSTPRPPEGTGLQGQAPGDTGQPGGPEPPGGAGTESPPPAEPAGPRVTAERRGDDVTYTILPGPAAQGGGAAGTPGASGSAPGDLTVRLEATERVWVRVRSAGGQVLFERLMGAGDTQEIPLGDGLELRVGYPRGLDLEVGGTPVDVPDEESPLNLFLEPSEGETAP